MSSGTCAEFIRQFLQSNCGSAPADTINEIYVDFEHPKPTVNELRVYEFARETLQRAEMILLDISEYGNGATEVIREAYNQHTDPAIQERAWSTTKEYVTKLKDYHSFSLSLEQLFHNLLWELCSGPLPPVEQLERQQALAKLFADCLDFVLAFDEVKMSTPAISNDFSFYRRTMSRYDSNSQKFGLKNNGRGKFPVDYEKANALSFFYAQPTPMLNTIVKAAEDFVKKNPNIPVENITDTLATMATICRTMVDTPELAQRFEHTPETPLFCIRVMVGAVVLYDHVHPAGAFARNSHINMKAVVKCLKSHPEVTAGREESLLNTLRYTTKNLNNPNTPRNIKNLLVT